MVGRESRVRSGAVVAGDVGGVTEGTGVVGTVTAGRVEGVVGRTVVAGDSSSTSGTVVVVAEDDPEPDEPEPDEPEPDELEPEPDDDPKPEPEREPEPDEGTDDAWAGVFPDRSGTLSGGVGSAGLALVMNRLKMSAGSEPPLTLATPWTL